MSFLLWPFRSLFSFFLQESKWKRLRGAIIDGDVQEAAQLIMSGNVNLNERNKNGETLLVTAMAGARWWNGGGRARFIVISLLLKHGADPSIGFGKRNTTILLMITREDDIDIPLLGQVLKLSKITLEKDPYGPLYFATRQPRGNRRAAVFLMAKYGLPNHCLQEFAETLSMCNLLVPLSSSKKVPADFTRAIASFLLGEHVLK